MIANITHTAQSKPLILYNEKKVEKGQATRIYYNGNDSESDKNIVINELSIATKASKRSDKYVHISLNFPQEDMSKLTDISLVEIANDYLKEMGFPDDQLKIIYRHFDTQHPHIHIVVPKIVKGRALTTTSNFKKSMMITRDLEKKYGLASVDRISEKEDYSLDKIQDFINQDSSSTLEKVKSFNSFFKVFNQQHKPVSFEEYQTQLAKFGIEVLQKQRDNTPVGLVYKRLNADEIPIKASVIYNSVPLKKMDRYFANNVKNRELRFKKIKDHFNKIQNKYDVITYDDLKLEFAKINIDVEYISKGTTINAYRFYDKDQNLYYKPSSIDRNISFAKISPKIGVKSEKNKKQQNNSILYYLEKQYKLEHGEVQDPMDYMLFMVKHGMMPVVRNNEVILSHLSVKSPEDKDYTRPIKLDIAKVDFKQISNIVNHKDYKKYVYNILTPTPQKQTTYRKRRSRKGPLLQVIDLLFNIGSAASRGRAPRLKIK